MAHADFRYHEDMEIVLLKRGIDRSMYRILSVLREQQPSSISHLAEIALLKRPTVSRAVERMRERGLVDATISPQDNRVTEVSMTAEGVALMKMLTPVVARQVARGFEGIPDKDIGRLIQVLQKIIANLNRLSIE